MKQPSPMSKCKGVQRCANAAAVTQVSSHHAQAEMQWQVERLRIPVPRSGLFVLPHRVRTGAEERLLLRFRYHGLKAAVG